MNRETLNRLRIMEQAGMLAPWEREALELMIQLVEEEYGIKVVGDNGDIFVHHMAMLLIRRRTGQQVSPLDTGILLSLQEDPRYPPSLAIADAITRACGIRMTPDEAVYVRMHLCAMMLA